MGEQQPQEPWLSGYKTYAVALLGALVVLAYKPLGWIDEETMGALLGLLGFGGLATMRAAVEKVKRAAENGKDHHG